MHLVDWRLAETTAIRLVPPGPKIELNDAVAVVEELRRTAGRADDHVAAVTGLEVSGAGAITAVVDRPEWVRANVESFRGLVDPILDTVLAKRADRLPGPMMTAVGARAAGVEVGLLLAYLATRVLGQFELLGPARSPDAAAGGRLTLVAPNIVATERAMQVDPADFRLWVCLHEVTHRTQFAAAPWLHEHVQGLLGEYLLAADLDARALWQRLRQAAQGLVGAARGESELSVVELIQTPQQREVLDRITGLMSLLEGHADVVMDLAGPSVVPSVATIRERFERRRREAGPLQRTLRRLLGIEMKMRQYAEGAAFVRAVLAEVGMTGLNVVWSDADRLPSATEIREPRRWLDRVGFPPAVSA